MRHTGRLLRPTGARSRSSSTYLTAMSNASEIDALRGVKVFFFDVFGTVLDWRSSVARELEERVGGDGARPTTPLVAC